MRLRSMAEYGIGRTPMLRARRFTTGGNLLVKIESRNPTGSIKDRLAYYLVPDTEMARDGEPRLVDSTSGNFGLAMMRMASLSGKVFVALADPTISPTKLKRLQSHGEVRLVDKGAALDYRSARIALAKKLGGCPGWRWTNQYDNPLAFRAYFETTGPEIWEQTHGAVTTLVCSVGTGGTICGTAHALKRRNPKVRVVAIEPLGSTIFGTVPGDYLNAGAGMYEPTDIIRRYSGAIDAFCLVPDAIALRTCREFYDAEGEGVGVTAGAALWVGAHLADKDQDETVVVVAPDGWANYCHLADRPTLTGPLPTPRLHLHDHSHDAVSDPVLRLTRSAP